MKKTLRAILALTLVLSLIMSMTTVFAAKKTKIHGDSSTSELKGVTLSVKVDGDDDWYTFTAQGNFWQCSKIDELGLEKGESCGVTIEANGKEYTGVLTLRGNGNTSDSSGATDNYWLTNVEAVKTEPEKYPVKVEVYTKIGADSEYSTTPDSSHNLGSYEAGYVYTLTDAQIAGYAPKGYTYDTGILSGKVTEDGLTLKLYFWKEKEVVPPSEPETYPVIVEVYTKIGADSEYSTTPDSSHNLGSYEAGYVYTLTDAQIAGYAPKGYTYDTGILTGKVTEDGLTLKLYFWKEEEIVPPTEPETYPVIVEVYTREGLFSSYAETANNTYNLGSYEAGYVYTLTDDQIAGYAPEGYAFDDAAAHVITGEVTEDGLTLKLYFWRFSVPTFNFIPVEPTTDIPEIDVPIADVPADEPVVDIPEEDVPLTDISEEDVPMADVPKTGDLMGLWMALSGVSLAGLVVLGKKRK